MLKEIFGMVIVALLIWQGGGMAYNYFAEPEEPIPTPADYLASFFQTTPNTTITKMSLYRFNLLETSRDHTYKAVVLEYASGHAYPYWPADYLDLNVTLKGTIDYDIPFYSSYWIATGYVYSVSPTWPDLNLYDVWSGNPTHIDIVEAGYFSGMGDTTLDYAHSIGWPTIELIDYDHGVQYMYFVTQVLTHNDWNIVAQDVMRIQLDDTSN